MTNTPDSNFVSLGDFFNEPTNEYCYEACRDRLLVAISVAKVEGYAATQQALIAILKELENCRNAEFQPLTNDCKDTYG